MAPRGSWLLTDAQLKAEVARCEYCAAKPCKGACPADCSPADFIMAVRVGEPSDFRRAAGMIMAANPLGGVCGSVCPDTHCMRSCARSGLDRPIDIPAVQATIIARARELGVMPPFGRPEARGRRVAVVGGGPAGVGAAALLAQEGCTVDVLEAGTRIGGMAGLIPPFRLGPDVLAADLAFIAALGTVSFRTSTTVPDPTTLLADGYDAVVVASGLTEAIRLGVPGEDLATSAFAFLANPAELDVTGTSVAIVGGGAVAVDCAETARTRGAARVELLALETLAELPLTGREREGLLEVGIEVTGRTRVMEILGHEGHVAGVRTRRVALPPDVSFHPSKVHDVEGTDQLRPDLESVIVAIGARPAAGRVAHPAVFLAGDVEHGPTTVVEAVAAGKNAALRVLEMMQERGQWSVVSGQSPTHPETGRAGGPDPGPRTPDPFVPRVKSTAVLPGFHRLPVPLDTDFFGTPILSPLLLSAAPPTDGYEQMRRAYQAGWAGGVMKTAFDNVPIHIPADYMVAFGERTFGNCDNVSGHALDRVCGEVERLRREFPDRLTLASTGGPVTGDDASDQRVWRSNTAKLEAAGACGIEYSLSCPQGGDGTRGDIVSQDAELTAKIIEWVLAASDPEVPKLFKLTAAVTSITPIITAIREVFARHPSVRAGVTLANTFPTLAFRRGRRERWEEGIVVGMSGEGVTPISNLTLATVSRLGVVVSGNGGPMDYKAAAHFLALGARTVQLCSVAMKYGVGIVDELHSGLSHLLEARGLASVSDLIGRALPDPVTGFGELTATKRISTVERALCVHCGNCTRCPYLAITLDAEAFPATDPARCVGCSFCNRLCFVGALSMRERNADEAAALVEG